MSRIRGVVVVSALLLPACGAEPIGPDPEITVSSVSVSPLAATIPALGETVQFSATVTGSNGAGMPDEPVTWSSSNISVAQVSATGLVTGLQAGDATITARAGSVDGSAQVAVCEATQAVSLTAGQAALYDTTDCLTLPVGQAQDRYRVVVFRPTSTENANDVTTVRLQVTQPAAAMATPVSSTASAALAALTDPVTVGLLEAARRSAITERAHREARAQDALLWAELGPDALATPRRAVSQALLRAAASPATIQLDPRTNSNSCSASTSETVTALLIHENDDLAVYQDSTQHATTPVTLSQASRMASYYSDYGKQVVEDYFGEPSDIDGNGKLVLFVTPAVGGGTAAQVWSGDFYDQSVCTASNEMELIYFNNEVVQLMDDANPSYQALETVVHEAKHVVSLWHRIAASNRTGSSEFHPSWIEEGTAEIAGEMSSRVAWEATGGPAVGAMIDSGDLRPGGGGVRVSEENYGILLRMVRTIYYLSSQPNGLVVTPTGAHDTHSVYGSGWNFHRWLGDAYGGASTPFGDATLFAELNDSLTAGGLDGLVEVTQQSYGELLEQFVLAVALHRVGPDPALPITTFDFVTATHILANQPDGAYPWPVTERSTQPGETIPAGYGAAAYIGETGASGIRIHDFQSSGTGSPAHISVDAVPPAKIMVVRVR